MFERGSFLPSLYLYPDTIHHTQSIDSRLTFISPLNLNVDLMLQHFEWRHQADLFLFTTLKASRPRLKYESIQNNTTGEWSCRSPICQTPDHISFHVQSNKSVCWSGLCEKKMLID